MYISSDNLYENWFIVKPCKIAQTTDFEYRRMGIRPLLCDRKTAMDALHKKRLNHFIEIDRSNPVDYNAPSTLHRAVNIRGQSL
jgi:hypothetical protein